MLEELKSHVCDANLELARQGLVTLTWGNVSGMDRASGLVVIKPSGVSYDNLTADVLTVVDLEGKVVEGQFAASTDTATHLCFYSSFPNIGGAVHTHSPFATAFAQASREIPCLGTTHADPFFGSVQVARMPIAKEVAEGYESNIGKLVLTCRPH